MTLKNLLLAVSLWGALVVLAGGEDAWVLDGAPYGAGPLVVTVGGTLQNDIGSPLYPSCVVLPVGTGAMRPSGIAGVGVDSITYTETNAGGGPRVTSMVFHNLVSARLLSITLCAALTSLNFPELVCVGTGNFAAGIGTCPAITEILCPKLEVINASLLFVAGQTSMANLSMPKLHCLGGALQVVGPHAMTTLSFPELTHIQAQVAIQSSTTLTTVSLPKLKTMGSSSGIVMTTGMGELVEVTIGAAGVTKYIAGNVTLTNNKLSEATVRRVVMMLASLDGNGGTVSWGTGKTLNISGGTSWAPDATCHAMIDVIEARGGTVTHNP